MPTQDFIYPRRVDKPRHEQNMPEGVVIPVPEPWFGGRPGDGVIDKSYDDLFFGNPGTDAGYARKLAVIVVDHLFLLEHENRHDVEALLAEIAMRRAAYFGRAPVKKDIVFAAHLFGFTEHSTQGEEKWRPQLVYGCGHDEHRRRHIVNSVPQDVIEGPHGVERNVISGWWEKLEGLI